MKIIEKLREIEITDPEQVEKIMEALDVILKEVKE